MTKLGVFIGNNASDLYSFEDWLGVDVDFVRAHTSRSSWSDYSSSVSWVISKLDSTNRDIYWSIPLIINGANLDDAASGNYNNYYKSVATIIYNKYQNEDIYIRTGEEFNGSWMPWAAKDKESSYIGAYQQFVDTFRSVSDQFIFEWNVNVGDLGMNPETAYPGDDYVDIIGMDFYYNIKWHPADGQAAWNWMVKQKYGLQWLEDFADVHDKPTAYSEWGINADDAGAYVAAAAAWFKDHDAVYQSYWNSNADFAGKLSDGAHPGTGAAYIAAFGRPVDLYPADPPPESGKPNIWRSGTSAADVIEGYARNDSINGGGGADRMIGKEGDDSYVVDRAADVVVELADQGIDTVTSYGSTYTLPAYVENLRLDGNNYGGVAIGNDLDSRITGSVNADTIEGGGGNDWLTGRGGTDKFVFKAGSGYDRITDFVVSGPEADLLDLRTLNLGSFANVSEHFTQRADGVAIELSSSAGLLLINIDADALSASNFLL